MIFNYDDIEAVSVDLKKSYRFYQTPTGFFYPSITTVLGDTMSAEKEQSLKNWAKSIGEDVAKAKTLEATTKGTAVHLLIERLLKGEDLFRAEEVYDDNMVSSFNCLKPYLKKIESIWGQEVALYSHALKVAGRCDCIGIYKGVPAIIDFKTSSRLKGSKDIDDYKLQLCAYAEMHNEQFNTTITTGVILMSSINGFPQEFTVNLVEQKDKLQARVDQFYLNFNKELLA